MFLCEMNWSKRVTLLGKPSIKDLPEKTILPVDDLAILTCEVSGDPEPSVTWSKDGDTNIPRAQFRNDGRILAIKDVLPIDSGVYECKASNKLGESRSSTLVVVAGKLYRLAIASQLSMLYWKVSECWKTK